MPETSMLQLNRIPTSPGQAAGTSQGLLATTHGNRIYVKAPAAASEQLKKAGCRFNDPEHPWVWSAPATPFMARRLAKYIPGLRGDSEFLALIAVARRNVKAKGAPVDQLPQASGMRHPLWQHQQECLLLNHTYPGTGLFLDMGAGKTFPSIAEIAELAKNNPKFRGLIVGPSAVVAVWPREFAKHTDPDQVHVHIVALDQKSVPARAKAATDALAYADAHNLPCVLVINYDSIWRAPIGPTMGQYEEKARNGRVYPKERIKEPGILLSVHWDVVIADEVHKICNPEAKRSLMMYRLRDNSDRRRALTGTPYTNGLLSVFGIMLFIEPGLLGTNFYQFRDRFAVLDDWGSVLDYKNQDDMQKLIDVVTIRYMLAEVCPEIQEDIEQTLLVSLPTNVQRSYNELRDEMYTEVWTADDKGIKIETNNVLTKILRLAQLAGGHAGNTETIEVGGKIRKVSTVEHVHSEKEDALEDWLEDIGSDQPAVVFVNFQPEIERIKQVVSKAGRLAYELSGSRNEWIEWMADQDNHNPALWLDGKAPVMIAQIDSGAAGIDFTRCNGRFVRYVCYYSLGNKRVNYAQSRGRVHRPGTDTTQKISVTHILAAGTIDEAIYDALLNKQEIIDAVLDKIRKERPAKQTKRAKKAA